MFLAIQQGYFSKAIDYIESADNVDIRDEEGKTPLIRCILLKDQQKAIGINDGLIRLSVGIEDIEDLIKDFDQALNNVFKKEMNYVEQY